ncbi:MAG: hypothetical protein QNJ46_04240 [Leptolyngbyaceae cyanobacterium MO_188.B28]|nr:hypothetical protein [Leptolyngbyaceae cyanobacterium MO_188.B28]
MAEDGGEIGIERQLQAIAKPMTKPNPGEVDGVRSRKVQFCRTDATRTK